MNVLEPTAGGSPLPASAANSVSRSSWRDSLGVLASVGCAIHCAAMPFVIAYLPFFGLSFLADEAFHRWMALICFLIAIAAFIPGFRVHRRLLPGAIATIGLVLITAAAFGLLGDCCATCEIGTDAQNGGTACNDACCEHCVAEVVSAGPVLAQESITGTASVASLVPLATLAPWVTPLGGLLLVSAHLLNRRYGCRCGCCETGPASAADRRRTG
ncbi:MerC domain-containing protein [Roseimaritima sediminicola]|uniref:MerC domain-containing protein n=1 Tax=Roseimaritima sediminicola TaxID=2662066 RepID=UPI001298359E|nr:MerC domain-containing protein [Roseimaritima sediminicola]